MLFRNTLIGVSFFAMAAFAAPAMADAPRSDAIIQELIQSLAETASEIETERLGTLAVEQEAIALEQAALAKRNELADRNAGLVARKQELVLLYEQVGTFIYALPIGAIEPTEPEVVEPTEPEVVEPTEPEVVEPTEPEVVEPTEPEVVEPTEPEVVEPTEPEVVEPTEPEVVEPTEPEVVEPTEPEVVEDEVDDEPGILSRAWNVIKFWD